MTRADLVAARAAWMERHRKTLAVAIASVGALLFSMDVTNGFVRPGLSMLTRMSFFVGFVVWVVATLVLAGVTTAWEAKAERLRVEEATPRAEVVRERKRRSASGG